MLPRAVYLDASACLEKLNKVHVSKLSMENAGHVQLLVLLKFFELRVDGVIRSQAASVAVEGLPKTTLLNPCTIYNWVRQFESTGVLPKSCQGHNQNT
ncbi:unnamed protein product [Aphanomyces euteiches]|uniref:Uncharacterized protein n=1 Tax=Aphanomyces euteiches TaxID=100861 RepID=A0A6G0XKC3_9STRA|nr:hypothetical protein Ae201684_003971 [Aphanomyces euteiches]KAH9084895.1 hypothetical protein Ae201684P_002129 [Aphanomyces euteiches]